MSTVCSVHKQALLRAWGALNLHPERVTAPLFCVNPFFDAHDLVQVKYEMLRAVETDGLCIQRAVRLFGFSRTTWYQIRPDYVAAGPPGLLPRQLKKSGGPTSMVLRFRTCMRAYASKPSARIARSGIWA